MNWTQKDEHKLLKRGFLFGLIGIIACLVPLFNRNLDFLDHSYVPLLTGIGIGAQLFALSITVLVLRKRGIMPEVKGKALRMCFALAVALLFFFMV